MKNIFRNADGEVNPQIVVATIGATATLLTAIIAGVFGLIQLQASRSQPPPSPTQSPVPQLDVEIEGPTEAPLNQETYFTILSDQAIRAEWTISDFGSDDINPFRQVDQIFVQPADAERVGDNFTVVVTVFDSNGNSRSARHRFEIVEGE